jgi:hypothetical protein
MSNSKSEEKLPGLSIEDHFTDFNVITFVVVLAVVCPLPN